MAKEWRIIGLLSLVPLWSAIAAVPVPLALRAVIFHEISPTHLNGPCASPDYFRDVLEMIRLGEMQTIFVDEAVSILQQKSPPPANMVAITFDDGWAGIRDYADPLLARYVMRATAFVHTAGTQNGRPWRCGWDDLREMVKTNRWEIHSHSKNHPHLTTLDDITLRNDLRESLEELRAHGFAKIGFIAYPFGESDERVRQATKEVGYAAGFAAGPDGHIGFDSDRYAIHRTTLCQLFDQNLVCRKLGLNLDLIRKNLAIYDEPSGEWQGKWETQKPDDPLGQYGYTYTLTTDSQALWSLTFSIAKPGHYRISLWSPAQGFIFSPEKPTCQWLLQNPAATLLSNGTVTQRIPNGWTELTVISLKSGNHRITLRPGTISNTPFVMDALKVEYLGK